MVKIVKNILIVSSRFYSDISDDLEKEAIKTLTSNNYKYDILSVPGAFEVPAVIAEARRKGGYSGFIALGCVIRGETDHYEHICREASRAIMSISIKYCVAIGFGILTCYNLDQAINLLQKMVGFFFVFV